MLLQLAATLQCSLQQLHKLGVPLKWIHKVMDEGAMSYDMKGGSLVGVFDGGALDSTGALGNDCSCRGAFGIISIIIMWWRMY